MAAYRLRNQNKPGATLGITVDTWNKILNLAEGYGWRPLSVDRPGARDWGQPLAGFYLGRPLVLYEEKRQERIGFVILEDALNLADALERAFIAIEPIYMPADYFYFKNHEIEDHLLPSIGAIGEVIQFCKLGPFWIEPFRNGFHDV